MGIYIYGMKMPKDGECIVVSSCGTARKYNPGDVLMYGDAYNEMADAIELPPHGRLIDADALEKHMSDTVMGDIRGYPYDGDTWDLAFSWLDHADTIIQADPADKDVT